MYLKSEKKLQRTEEWNLRAARCVFRYVRKNGVFDTFFDVLTRGETSSKCCAGINEKLPGSHGRLCIFILRLFRFPWIRHDIQAKSTLNCRHQTDRKTVCLNPWHYRQVEIPHVPCPPIVINKNLDYGKPPERSENPLDEELTHHEMQVDQMTDEEREKRIPNVTMMGDELKMAYERHLYNPDDFNAMHALFTPPY
uniref:MH1 domain-containing protein n=1 Tax=Caenorhabditis japonica TaxID=281687 RepID=A0A8R1ERD5_CAEJA